MQAGLLRKRIVLQQKVDTRDGFGQQINTWTDIATVWAEVMALSGSERLHAKQVDSEDTLRITVRYRSELANPRTVNAWRFTFDNRTININSVLYDDMKKRIVVLLCSEGLNDGQ